MRRLVPPAWLLALGLGLLGPPRVAAGPALGLEGARHLLVRTGFGPTWDEVQSYAQLNRDQAIEKILGGIQTEARTPPPGWVHEPAPVPGMQKMLPQFLRMTMRQERNEQEMQLKAWWIQEILTTSSPLSERMTLFWHNHFTSSFQKVKWPPLLYFQNLKLRRNALGNFATLLQTLSKDPAMVLYLDNQSNRKGKPNENFAREVMELFTLGEGNYTEKDIKEAARAFTGWSVDPARKFLFRRGNHDQGVKTVLGRSGNFNGDDVLAILLDQPACAPYIAGKIFRFFVGVDPDEARKKELGQVFRDQNFEIQALLRTILKSPEFWDPAHRGIQIKSPVDLLVGTIRALGLDEADPEFLARQSKRLGQDLFAPPNVKGWPGGNLWVSSHTLLIRDQLLRRAGGVMNQEGSGPDLARLEPKELTSFLLPIAPHDPVPKHLRGRRLIQRLLQDPTYQLF